LQDGKIGTQHDDSTRHLIEYYRKNR